MMRVKASCILVTVAPNCTKLCNVGFAVGMSVS